MRTLTATALMLMLALSISANDHSADYKMGTFVSARVTEDGTLTDTVHGDGTTVAGSVSANTVAVYEIDVTDGKWFLETSTQAGDSMLRNMGQTPVHFKSEKANPLDVLKNGDKVLFRVEQHKKIGGTETDVLIPFADNPNKEFKFVGTFITNSLPAQSPQKPTDNVKAMCDSHKLSPDLEKQFCSAPSTSPVTPAPNTANATPTATPMEQLKKMCDSGMFKTGVYANQPFYQQQCDAAFPPAKQ